MVFFCVPASPEQALLALGRLCSVSVIEEQAAYHMNVYHMPDIGSRESQRFFFFLIASLMLVVCPHIHAAV